MLVPSLLVYFNLCMWLQHAATLDEMRKDTGMVESFTIGRNCAASLMLRTDDGALRHYSFCERDETRPQRVIGKGATVWSEAGLIPPFVWERHLMQLQVGTTFERKFDPRWSAVVNHDFEKIIEFFLPFFLIPLFRVWWVNRKSIPDRQDE